MTRAARGWLGVLAACAVVGCSDDQRTIYVTPTQVPGEATATATVEGTAAATSPAVDATPTPDVNATPTLSVVPTGTPAGTASGPVITYFGVSSADDRPLASSGMDSAGRPIYERLLGAGLNIIVEVGRAADSSAPGLSAYDENGGLPDLQLLVSRALGDGSSEVCDVDFEGVSGGVPGVDPPLFSNPAATADVINDLGCRVNDGAGQASGRPQSSQACTHFESGEFAFVNAETRAQFCLPIARAWAFPQGDTIVTARARSVRGELGEPAQIVVRVERESPSTPLATGTPEQSPEPTLTPVPPRLTYLGVASAEDLVQTPVGTDSLGRPIFERLLGHAFSLIVEGAPQPGGRPVGSQAYDDSGLPPDLQMLVSRDLGDGSEEVCDFDIDEELFGGIPGIDPPVFSDDPAVVGAMNDLGCRVNDGTGLPVGRQFPNACTRTASGNFEFADPLTTVQFCLPIAQAWKFPPGDTIVAARLRSTNGGISAPEEIVIRVREGDSPLECDETGLGLRSFSVARPGSGFLVAESATDVSADPWMADDLQLCAGVDSGDGVRSLRLLEDVIIGFPVEDGSIVCAKIFARESGGILDCDGVQGHDVERVLDADTLLSQQMLGLGDPGTPGAATLSTLVSLVNLPVGATTDDCLLQPFVSKVQLVLTTGTATGSVINSDDETMPELSVQGDPFDCSQWTDSGAGGGLVFVWPLSGQPAIGDTVLGLVLQD